MKFKWKDMKKLTNDKIIELLKTIYNKTISSEIKAMKPLSLNNKDIFHVVHNKNEKKNVHLTTEEERQIILKYYPHSKLLNNATTYNDMDNNLFVDDGGLLCGVVYKINNDKTVEIFARK